MNKLNLTSVLTAITLFGFGQQNWTNGLNNFSDGGPPRIGTISNHPINFWTKGTQKMSLGTDGVLNISGLAGEGDRILVVDAAGNLRQAGGGQAFNCGSTTPWYGGGNKSMGISNDIGTCDDKDFILKANDKKLLFITPATTNGRPYSIGVGLNNNEPLALFDVSDGLTNIYQAVNHTRIYGDADGTIEAFAAPMTLMSSDGLFYRIGSPGSSYQLFSVDGAGTHMMAATINGLANITGLAKINAGTSGYAFSVNNASAGDVQAIWTDGKASFGKISGSVNQAQLNVNVTTSNSNAIDIYDITSGRVNFRVLSSGKTRIGDQASAPNSAQLNVNVSAASITNAFAVWDQSANSGSGDHNFLVKSTGYTYCRELQVMTGAFPDYVFDKSYKLKALNEVESYINTNKHLPGFENADYYIQNGIKTSEMFVKQQEKIEELTLYIIELEKRLQNLEKNK